MKAIQCLLSVDCFLTENKSENSIFTKLTHLSIILILTQKDIFIRLYCH